MLAKLTADYPVVSMIGICKNAGKTTTMCQLIEELPQTRLAITSIGRDGEGVDVVTGTEKPAIWVKKNTLFATTTGLLPLCDVTIEVLETTPFSTPIGNVAIFKALSSGNVQLAGPSIVEDLNTICQRFFSLGAQKVIIDGAAGRKSLAGISFPCCGVLCVGASFSPVMEQTVAETKHICTLFNSPKLEDGRLRTAILNCNDDFGLFSLNGIKLPLTLNEQQLPNLATLPMEDVALWVSGSITNRFLQAVAMRGVAISLIVPDATHLLCDKAVTEAFLRQGGSFKVIKAINIVAISPNPWSAYGNHYSKQLFFQCLAKAVPLPIIDVKEGIYAAE